MFEVEPNLLDRVRNRFIGSLTPEGQLGTDPARNGDVRSWIVSSTRASGSIPGATDGGYSHLYCWALLPSCNAPRWLLPLGDVSTTIAAAQIYQPLGFGARVAKYLLLRAIQMRWKAWARHKLVIAAKERLPLEHLVRDVTGEPNPVFAMLVGNQLVMRKLAVLVMRPDATVLGYIKLPLTEAAGQRVRHEARTLELLADCCSIRPHIPRVLYAGPYGDSYVLFQTAAQGRPGCTLLKPMHQKFLDKLHAARRNDKRGNVIVEEARQVWQQSLAQLEPGWEELGQEVLRRSTRVLSNATVPCSVIHGDFAPWNTRVEFDRLFAFDWESAAWEAPSQWDAFHFQVQTTCFLKKASGIPASYSDRIQEASFLLYLLVSASQLIQHRADRTGIDYRRSLLKKRLSGGACMYGDSAAPPMTVSSVSA